MQKCFPLLEASGNSSVVMIGSVAGGPKSSISGAPYCMNKGTHNTHNHNVTRVSLHWSATLHCLKLCMILSFILTCCEVLRLILPDASYWGYSEYSCCTKIVCGMCGYSRYSAIIMLWTGFQYISTQEICCSCHRHLGQGAGSRVGPCWSQVQCNQARSRWNWAHQGILSSTCERFALLTAITLLRNALPWDSRRMMAWAVNHASRCRSSGYKSPVPKPCHLHFNLKDCFLCLRGSQKLGLEQWPCL